MLLKYFLNILVLCGFRLLHFNSSFDFSSRHLALMLRVEALSRGVKVIPDGCVVRLLRTRVFDVCLLSLVFGGYWGCALVCEERAECSCNVDPMDLTPAREKSNPRDYCKRVNVLDFQDPVWSSVPSDLSVNFCRRCVWFVR